MIAAAAVSRGQERTAGGGSLQRTTKYDPVASSYLKMQGSKVKVGGGSCYFSLDFSGSTKHVPPRRDQSITE